MALALLTASTADPTRLLFSAGLSVVALIFLIARFKLNAFVALILVSIFMGLAAGMPLLQITKAFQQGVGDVLSSVAPIVGLGTILGKLLMESGAARVIARRLLAISRPQHLPWTMLLLGLIVGIPTWFAVGLVLLTPILFTVYRESGRPFLSLALPMLAGLSIMHGLVPPHPGPVVAIELLQANAGDVLLLSLLIGVPTALLAGPILASMLGRNLQLKPQPKTITATGAGDCREPGFLLSLFTIFLPIALMLSGTIAEMSLQKASFAREVVVFLANPLVALLAAVLFSFWSFGAHCRFNRERLGRFAEESLGPIASVLLVVGAGGGFSRVLLGSGIGTALTSVTIHLDISPLVLGWLAAAMIRIATGSATVAITTAAGLMVPIVAGSQVSVELLIVAMAAGSLVLSHLNDGGFWLVKEYFGLTVPETLKTWTLMETVISLFALVLVLLINRLL